MMTVKEFSMKTFLAFRKESVNLNLKNKTNYKLKLKLSKKLL